MKNSIFILGLSILFQTIVTAQWDVLPSHVSFIYGDDDYNEHSHWIPQELSFWSDGTYSSGSTIDANLINVYTSSGLKTKMYAGQIRTEGENTFENIYIGPVGEKPNHGYVGVMDSIGRVKAGMYVNNDHLGAIFADVKNFRVPHPELADKDIWYACIEGPEAAIYDRGTGQLKNGEAFIPFSDHYGLMANPSTTTIQLTSNDWDTYGLAVIRKTADGFYVKELKGGTGNFTFDWECKSIRKGKESYQVIRPNDYVKNLQSKDLEIPKVKTRSAHDHHNGCKHNAKGQ